MKCKPQTNKTRKTKTPKKITETYLHNAGLYYLQRFSASKKQFFRVMDRKIKKSCAFHEDQSYETSTQILEKLIQKFEEIGLLNDEIYTQAQITSLRRQGKSKRAIMSKLHQKGVPPDLGKEKLYTLDTQNNENEKNAELSAARTFARKKRLGAFAPSNTPLEPEGRKKALAKFARAGFSYEIANKVLEENLAENLTF